MAPGTDVPDVGGTIPVLQYLLTEPPLHMTMSALVMPLLPTATPTHASLDRVKSNSMVLLSFATAYVPERLLSNFNSPDAPAMSAEDGLGAVDEQLRRRVLRFPAVPRPHP